MPLDANAIKAYLEIYDAPCELYIFVECVFALDNKHLDKAHKRLSSQVKKPS